MKARRRNSPPVTKVPYLISLHAMFQESHILQLPEGKNLKIKLTLWRRPRFVLDRAWLTGCLGLWWSLQLFFSQLFFSLLFFQKLFSLTELCPFFRRNQYSTVFDCDCKTSREFNGPFLLRALEDPKLVFHCPAAWPSRQPLWWGVISFQNFRSLKLGLYFCVDFLASSELTGYVDLTDSYEIWPECSLVINAKKYVRLFLIFQILLLLRALMWRRSANIQFVNFKIDFLGDQSE